ncbi:hypothetical protein GPECTOR_53g79 [Gonium pectorale]|uniref:Kinesin motor domain-containing protein n=1 Tax=Gonium pectorale TaxID=33097 RepID=A0A150G6T9_GONPE|nr:hypothetical protein GPECTOR_53g79 [Gonium pectorale]|eukprot:KXZ45586.1 hypothetical protein GPECTOR_53g79 [Gonium pectorale]
MRHAESEGVDLPEASGCSGDKERQRGDRVAWAADGDGNVGTVDASGAFTAKHRFDTVFGPDADNQSVASALALPLVGPALEGINGTIFAYGVTSSGKTHTMMGTDAVLNDLLDPARANLKALELMRAGDHNRKVGATAFNEDSSRSHTLTRIIVESIAQQEPTAAPAAAGAPPTPGPAGGRARRTVACLSLIDLAGSESARAVVSKGQRMEGSFINRSLLTLGTVIHKLAAGVAGHVPFRDSKLTRLLQPSLSGPGARVAVVCNVTPAAAQSDETSNTLKFAARAKLVQVTARTNEVLDERALLRRYQKEVADLKRQLAEARAALAAAGVRTGASGGGAEAGGEVGEGAAPCGLLRASSAADDAATTAALQAERDARRAAEMDATMLRIKMARLQAFLEERGVNVDDVVLGGAVDFGGSDNASLQQRCASAARSTPVTPGRGLRHAVSTPSLTGDAEGDESHPVEPASGATTTSGASGAGVDGEAGNIPTSDELRERVAEALAASAAAAAAGGAGGAALGSSGHSLGGSSGSEVEVDEELNEGLMAQIRDMISEAQLAGGTADGTTASAGAAGAGPPQARSQPASDTGGEVMLADREVLHDQLVAAEEANEQLTAQVAGLRRQLVTYEQLTRQAAGELAEIRRLKEAFQARLQRENDELRAALAALGGAVPPPGGKTSPRSPPSPHTTDACAAGAGGAPALSGQAAAAAATYSTPVRVHHLQQQALSAQRYGVQSMAAFGSPAPVAYAASPATHVGGAFALAGTPTRATAPPGVPRPGAVRAQEAGGPALQPMPSFGASFGTPVRPSAVSTPAHEPDGGRTRPL